MWENFCIFVNEITINQTMASMNDYMFRPHQKWTVIPAGKGGYLGGSYYKICIEGTTRCLTTTSQHDVVAKHLGHLQKRVA